MHINKISIIICFICGGIFLNPVRPYAIDILRVPIISLDKPQENDAELDKVCNKAIFDLMVWLLTGKSEAFSKTGSWYIGFYFHGKKERVALIDMLETKIKDLKDFREKDEFIYPYSFFNAPSIDDIIKLRRDVFSWVLDNIRESVPEEAAKAIEGYLFSGDTTKLTALFGNDTLEKRFEKNKSDNIAKDEKDLDQEELYPKITIIDIFKAVSGTDKDIGDVKETEKMEYGYGSTKGGIRYTNTMLVGSRYYRLRDIWLHLTKLT